MVDRLVQATGPTVLALFVLMGVRVSPQPLAVSVVAGVVAVAVSVVLAARSTEGWAAFAGTATATAAVAVICSGSTTANLGWFALCVLCGWCALRAGPPQAVLLCGGTVAFLVVWGAFSREQPEGGMAERHVRLAPEAHGYDVVTVILADFRGLDTLVEITVVAVAVLGVVTLVRERVRT
jgi:multisubunit Na+/H+ antiporter MnhB subunit